MELVRWFASLYWQDAAVTPNAVTRAGVNRV